MLTTTLPAPHLSAYVAAQLTAFFPDRPLAARDVGAHVAHALERAEHCFSRVIVKRFGGDGAASFDHLNTDQYAMFLYLLSNTIFRAEGDPAVAAKVYALNKALHGLDVFYEIELPEVFSITIVKMWSKAGTPEIAATRLATRARGETGAISATSTEGAMSAPTRSRRIPRARPRRCKPMRSLDSLGGSGTSTGSPSSAARSQNGGVYRSDRRFTEISQSTNGGTAAASD